MVTTTEGRESVRVSHRFLVPRLSLMMFMQFFIWGSWSVTLGLVMTRYEMSLLIGDAFSAGPIASILSPFVLGMLVDRFFASQKVMAVMHLAGAAILWFVPQALVAQNGALLIGLLFGYTLCYMPTLALTNNIAFHSLANVDKTFPVVRVFGTIGWIIAGICIGVTGISDTTGIFTVAALCSVALAIYSLTLPHTPAPAKGMPVQFRDLLCADAFALLKTRHFLIFSLCATLISIPLGLAFYLDDSAGLWALAGLQIPHAIAYYGLFSIFSSFWAAPVFAALTNVIASSRLATSLSIYNLLLTAVGGGLGPLAVGLLSDAFSVRAGNESLRWALICMLAFYALALLIYAGTIKSYASMVTTKKMA